MQNLKSLPCLQAAAIRFVGKHKLRIIASREKGTAASHYIDLGLAEGNSAVRITHSDWG